MVLEVVTMGTDWDAMWSAPSEGSDSVKTLTERQRQEAVRTLKHLCVCMCCVVSNLVQPLVAEWWGRFFLLRLHREQQGRGETRTSPDLYARIHTHTAEI